MGAKAGLERGASATTCTDKTAQKAPLKASASTWLRHHWEQEGSKAGQLTSRWNCSCTVPSPELGLSRNSSGNMGSHCAVN